MEVLLKKITYEDLPMFQSLLEKCSDYLTFQEEEPVKPSAAHDLFNAKPESANQDNKVVFGIVDDAKQLIGLIDLIMDYPEPKTLSLGLMLLEPSSRGKGTGDKAYKLLEEWMVGQRFNRIRLGVLLGNSGGLNFWKRMGYNETGEVKNQMRRGTRLSKKFMVLEREIGVGNVI